MGFRDANASQPQQQQRQAPPQRQAQGRQQPAAAPPRGRAPQQQRQAPPQQEQYDDGQQGDEWDQSAAEYEQEQQQAPQGRGFARGRAQAPQGRQQPQGRPQPQGRGGYQAPGGAPRGRAPARGPGRFAGVKANEPQYETPHPGNYLFQFVTDKVTDGSGNEYYNATLLVLESDNPLHEVGSYVTFLQGLSGEQFRMGAPRMKGMAIAMLGFETEDDFNMKFPPDGREVLNAMYEGANEYLPGEGAYCRVYPTNSINQKTGLPFNDYAWEVCDPSVLPPLAAA